MRETSSLPVRTGAILSSSPQTTSGGLVTPSMAAPMFLNISVSAAIFSGSPLSSFCRTLATLSTIEGSGSWRKKGRARL